MYPLDNNLKLVRIEPNGNNVWTLYYDMRMPECGWQRFEKPIWNEHGSKLSSKVRTPSNLEIQKTIEEIIKRPITGGEMNMIHESVEKVGFPKWKKFGKTEWIHDETTDIARIEIRRYNGMTGNLTESHLPCHCIIECSEFSKHQKESKHIPEMYERNAQEVVDALNEY